MSAEKWYAAVVYNDDSLEHVMYSWLRINEGVLDRLSFYANLVKSVMIARITDDENYNYTLSSAERIIIAYDDEAQNFQVAALKPSGPLVLCSTTDKELIRTTITDYFEENHV